MRVRVARLAVIAVAVSSLGLLSGCAEGADGPVLPSGIPSNLPTGLTVPTGITIPTIPSVDVDTIFAPLYDRYSQLKQLATDICEAGVNNPAVTGLKTDYTQIAAEYERVYNTTKQLAEVGNKPMPTDLPAKAPSVDQSTKNAGCGPN